MFQDLSTCTTVHCYIVSLLLLEKTFQWIKQRHHSETFPKAYTSRWFWLKEAGNVSNISVVNRIKTWVIKQSYTALLTQWLQAMRKSYFDIIVSKMHGPIKSNRPLFANDLLLLWKKGCLHTEWTRGQDWAQFHIDRYILTKIFHLSKNLHYFIISIVMKMSNAFLTLSQCLPQSQELIHDVI